MVKFAFRQRVGKINWNVVSAVCIQDVVEHLKVNELQTVLDAITFCEFRPSDVKNCPIETVVQLVQIFQFTIEFLLHSQESQNVLIDRMHRKNTTLKDSNRHLSAQVASYKEDTKIYQRQLLVLRQSMNIREPQNPRVVDLKRKDSSDIQPIVASVLQSEKESREHLRVLLEDQRIAFMKELELNRMASMNASVAASSAAAKSLMASAPSYKEDSMERLMMQMKDILKEQQEQQRVIVAAALSSQAAQNDARNNARNDTSSQDIVSAISEREYSKTRKLQEETKKLQDELEMKTRELALKEENLMLDLRDFKNLQKAEKDKERAKIYLSSIDTLALLKPNSEESIINLREKSRVLSAITIKAQIQQALSRQMSKAFRVWVSKVNEYKESVQIAEHSRLLASSMNSHSRREQELIAQLQSEKQKALIESARLNTIAKSAERSLREQQIQLEEAQQALSEMQNQSIQQTWNPNASVATSTEQLFASSAASAAQTSTPAVPLDPWLLATLKMRLGSAMNGDEALALAQQRMSEKRQSARTETPVKQHMNMLASEIATRLKITDFGSSQMNTGIKSS